MRLRILALLATTTACSPTPPPVTVPKPVATVKPPPPPPPTAARWVFPDSASHAAAQWPLEKGTLQVGDQGRRWILEPDGKSKAADTLAIGSLVDVRTEDGKYLFLGSDGAVQSSDTPLGALVRRGEAPSDKARSFRFGQKAVLGVTLNGTVLRAADPTAKWATASLGLAAHERVVALETDRKGRVLVLAWPQRLFASTDDGATFTSVPLPGIGAEGLLRDAHGDLFLKGAFGALAKLDGAKFDTSAKPVALATGATEGKEEDTHLVLTGDRVSAITTNYKGPRKIELAIGAIDGALGKRHLIVDKGGGDVVVGGYADHVALAIEDYDGDPGVRIFHSTDDGKTLEPLGSFDGRPDAPFRIDVGPKGWMMVSGTCEDSGPCTGPHVRIGGAWKVLDATARVSDLAIDEKNQRVYFWDRERHRLMMLGLADTHASEVGVDLKDEPISMTVDDTGTLRLAHGTPLRLTRISATGGAQPPLYLPFMSYALALSGHRGLATAVGGGGWETMDGGEHWGRVAVAGYGELTCGKAGCVAANAMRVGWDLPAIGGELVASTDEPKVKSAFEQPKPQVAEPQVKLTCTFEEKWTKLEQVYGTSVSPSVGDVRFLDLPFSKKGVVAQVGRAGAAPKVLELLPPPKADSFPRTARAQNEFGATLGRFTFGPKKDGVYSPVDVELGLYDAASGKTGKAKLPQVKPFRVGRISVSALLQNVDGGVLFAPDNDDAPIYFVRLDGKVETIPRPPKGPSGGRYRAAVRTGKQLVLATMAYGSSVEIVATKDQGKTWTRTVWTLGDMTQLTSIGGAPVLVSSGSSHLIYPLDALGPELPTVKVIARAKASPLAACDPKVQGGIFSSDYPSSALRLSVSSAKDPKALPLELNGQRRVTRIGLDGKACAAGLAAQGAQSTVIVAPHDLTHGYLLREKDGTLSSAPLSCKAP